MKHYSVTASDGNIHDIEADYWENYEGSVDFGIRAIPGEMPKRVRHFFFRPIAIIEVDE